MLQLKENDALLHGLVVHAILLREIQTKWLDVLHECLLPKSFKKTYPQITRPICPLAIGRYTKWPLKIYWNVDGHIGKYTDMKWFEKHQVAIEKKLAFCLVLVNRVLDRDTSFKILSVKLEPAYDLPMTSPFQEIAYMMTIDKSNNRTK